MSDVIVLIFLLSRQVAMSDVIVLIFLLSRQVAMSDVIIINKTDLVTEEELHKLKSRVR